MSPLLAAALAEALDDRGKIRPGPAAEGMVGLLDIGGHTVNVAPCSRSTVI